MTTKILDTIVDVGPFTPGAPIPGAMKALGTSSANANALRDEIIALQARISPNVRNMSTRELLGELHDRLVEAGHRFPGCPSQQWVARLHSLMTEIPAEVQDFNPAQAAQASDG